MYGVTWWARQLSPASKMDDKIGSEAVSGFTIWSRTIGTAKVQLPKMRTERGTGNPMLRLPIRPAAALSGAGEDLKSTRMAHERIS
jgi:hypothetical protein